MLANPHAPPSVPRGDSGRHASGGLKVEHPEVVALGAFPEKKNSGGVSGVALGAFPVKTPQWAWLEVALRAS